MTSPRGSCLSPNAFVQCQTQEYTATPTSASFQYQFDPYNMNSSKKFLSVQTVSFADNDWCCGNTSVASSLSPSSYESFPSRVPFMTHEALLGVVSFSPFPEFLEDIPKPVAPCGKNQMVRLFIGQLPFAVTDAQIDFAIATATGGCHVYFVERIVNWKKGRTPTGCIHAHCLEIDFLRITRVNQQVLFDSDGVWVPTSPQQHSDMADYIRSVSAEKKGKRCNVPHQAITVERANSTYIRDENFAVNSFPARYSAASLSATATASEPAHFSKAHIFSS